MNLWIEIVFSYDFLYWNQLPCLLMILGDVPYELGHPPKLRALSTGNPSKWRFVSSLIPPKWVQFFPESDCEGFLWEKACQTLSSKTVVKDCLTNSVRFFLETRNAWVQVPEDTRYFDPRQRINMSIASRSIRMWENIRKLNPVAHSHMERVQNAFCRQGRSGRLMPSHCCCRSSTSQHSWFISLHPFIALVVSVEYLRRFLFYTSDSCWNNRGAVILLLMSDIFFSKSFCWCCCRCDTLASLSLFFWIGANLLQTHIHDIPGGNGEPPFVTRLSLLKVWWFLEMGSLNWTLILERIFNCKKLEKSSNFSEKSLDLHKTWTKLLKIVKAFKVPCDDHVIPVSLWVKTTGFPNEEGELNKENIVWTSRPWMSRRFCSYVWWIRPDINTNLDPLSWVTSQGLWMTPPLLFKIEIEVHDSVGETKQQKKIRQNQTHWSLFKLVHQNASMRKDKKHARFAKVVGKSRLWFMDAVF